MRNKLLIPKFEDEDEERNFWSKLDLSKHFNRSDFKRASFPNLKLTNFRKQVFLELPKDIIERIKKTSRKRKMSFDRYVSDVVKQGVIREKRAEYKVKKGDKS